MENFDLIVLKLFCSTYFRNGKGTGATHFTASHTDAHARSQTILIATVKQGVKAWINLQNVRMHPILDLSCKDSREKATRHVEIGQVRDGMEETHWTKERRKVQYCNVFLLKSFDQVREDPRLLVNKTTNHFSTYLKGLPLFCR